VHSGQSSAEHLRSVTIIVDYEHSSVAARRTSRGGNRQVRRHDRPGNRSGSAPRPGKRDDELAALPMPCAIGVYLPAMQTDEISHDRQTEAQSATRPIAGLTTLLEGVENFLEPFRINAGSLIRDGQTDGTALPPPSNRNRRSPFAVSRGIRQQIR